MERRADRIQKKKRTQPFSDNYIRGLKPEKFQYQEREGRGFGIRVLPSGVKTWLYIYMFEGKRRQMNLGQYYTEANPPASHVNLATAHKLYRAAFDLVQSGIDPQAAPDPIAVVTEPETTQALDNDDNITIETLVERYHTHIQATLVKKSVYDQYRTLTVDVLPEWRGRLIRDIKRPHSIKLLEEKSKTAPGQANNILKTTRAMFSYALDRELIESNPFSRLTRAVPQIKPKKRRRFLSADEIKYVWDTFHSSQKLSLIQRILLLTLATGQRAGEVCAIEWNEIEFGQGKPLCKTCMMKCGWWTIPANKIKTENRRDNPDPQPFRVYLSPLAASLLPIQSQELRNIGVHWVFPSAENGPVRENSLSQYVQRAHDLKAMDWAPHDLRRTFASHLPSIGCTQEHIDRIQNHVIPGVGGTYNRYQYDAEKLHWELQWSLRLQEISCS
ncbi:MAG: tyrosine-type recombinase/integrase [Geobacter sp.]|nr:tyrosine-type recombinase/integrase [Geobacter sp.]